MPFIGAGAGLVVISRSKQDTFHDGDDDSQDGILRRDGFEISYIPTEHDRETSREHGHDQKNKATTSFS